MFFGKEESDQSRWPEGCVATRMVEDSLKTFDCKHDEYIRGGLSSCTAYSDFPIAC